MFDEWQDVGEEGCEAEHVRPAIVGRAVPNVVGCDRVVDLERRQLLAGALEIQRAKPDLLHVVHAGARSGRLAGGLHGRQEQANQCADDRDNDEQFDEGESSTAAAVSCPDPHACVDHDKPPRKKIRKDQKR